MSTEVYVGRVRSVVPHALLSLLTLGLYFFVWFGMVAAAIRRHRKEGPSAGVLLFIFIILPVVGWFLATFLAAGSLRRIQTSVDADRSTGRWTPALWALVPIIGWTVAAGILQAGANRAWLRLHADMDHATSSPIVFQCPQCANRFNALLSPFGANALACPSCGRTADL